MKKEYITPDLEIVAFILNDVCGKIVHASNEYGGSNRGWGYGKDADEEDFYGLQ